MWVCGAGVMQSHTRSTPGEGQSLSHSHTLPVTASEQHFTLTAALPQSVGNEIHEQAEPSLETGAILQHREHLVSEE